MLNEREKKYLFLVVLGGTAGKANVELHDVRWVIGSKIEDTYNVLRRDWFGNLDGLHIDSYKKINYVDGYKVNLKNVENMKNNKNNCHNDKVNSKNLWFVNIGGYDPSCMQEKHEFCFVVASTKLEAKNIALSKLLIGFEKRHKDDITKLKTLSYFDNCQAIKKINNWQIELNLDENFVEQNESPDWFGYKRIDKI